MGAIANQSSVATETPLGRLALRAAELPYADIPAATRRHAARVFADTVGVILGGSRLPHIAALAHGDGPAGRLRAAGDAQLLARGAGSTSAEVAALVNGTAGTCLELDEGVRPTGHPAVHVVPAALAVAQATHASGRSLLAAVISGYEVAARLFAAYRLREPVHPHGNLGAAGAAVAVARLLGTDPAAAAVTAAGLPVTAVFDPCFEGAQVRDAYAGMAGVTGIAANRLAAAGFTPSATAYETVFGGVLGDPADPALLEAGVDPAALRIERNYFKLHSACALTHAAIDAALAIDRPAIADIAEVEVFTIANNMRVARQPVANALSARFSLEYAVATALINGHAGPDAFGPDSRALDLARRVVVAEDPAYTAEWPAKAAARVRVHAADRVLEATVENPRGHHANPADERDLRGKFSSLAAAAGAAGPAADYDVLIAVDAIEDVAELTVEAASNPTTAIKANGGFTTA